MAYERRAACSGSGTVESVLRALTRHSTGVPGRLRLARRRAVRRCSTRLKIAAAGEKSHLRGEGSAVRRSTHCGWSNRVTLFSSTAMAEQLAEALAAAIGGGFSKVALYPMDMCGRHAASSHTPRAPTVSLVHRSVWAYIQTDVPPSR